MAAIGTYGALKTAVTAYAVRQGDTVFADQLPLFVELAEMRIFNGNGGGMPSDPLRVTEMESAETDIALTAGAGVLPATCLALRRVRWDGSPKTVPDYEAPGVFWTNRYTTTGGSPVAYTVEGNRILVSPMVTGNLKAVFYARPAAFVADVDTNTILTTYPALYLHASLMEAGMFMRDEEFTAQHYAAYRSALDGVLSEARRRRMGGGRIAPRIPGARL